MKKYLKTLLILLTMLVGIVGIDVKAGTFAVDEKSKTEGGESVEYYNEHPEYRYSWKGKDTYCVDSYFPHSTGNYKVSYVLGSTDDIKVKAYDMGLLEILKKGSGNYYATNLALRTYVYGLGYGLDASFNASTNTKNCKYVNSFLVWASSYVDVVNSITSTDCSEGNFGSCYYNYLRSREKYNPWFSKIACGSDSFSGDNAAHEIFKAGMEKARSVIDNNANAASANIGGTASSTATNKKTINEYTDVVRIEEYHHQTLEFKNFSKSKGYIKNISLTCSNCVANSINLEKLEIYNKTTKKYEYYSDVIKSGTNFLTGDALKNYVTTSGGTEGATISGSMKFRFKLTRDKYNENCDKVSFKLEYQYFDPSASYAGALLIADEGSDNAQRFYVGAPSDGSDSINGSIDGEIKCAISCETEYESPTCSYDEDDAIAKIDGPINIKNCLINKSDEAGNPYQYTENAGGVSNDYCSVYCKEDYAEIKFTPIVKNVKCGGYLKLTSKVTGKKTCYTAGNTADKSINKEQYLTDIKHAQEKMVEAMNLYYKYNAIRNNSRVTEYDSNNIIINYGSYTKIVFTWDGENGSFHNELENTGGSNIIISSLAAVDEQLKDAEEALNDAKKEYVRIIKNYNACTTGWKNEYAFAQKIKYYYDENRGEDDVYYSPYLDLLKNREDLQYLVKNGNEEVDSSIIICTGKNNNRYICDVGWRLYDKDGDIDNDALDEYNYNASYGSDTFQNRNYVVCSTDGCKADTRKISIATFVEKGVKKEQEYMAPTAFYQIAGTGKVVAYDNYSFKDISLEELTNKLPISSIATGWGNIKLMVEDLGEFYSEKGAYGRLIDFNGINEEKSVVSKKGEDVFIGEYSCYYENPCKPENPIPTPDDSDNPSEPDDSDNPSEPDDSDNPTPDNPNNPPCITCVPVCEPAPCKWIDCPNCPQDGTKLFDYGELNLHIKTITTTDVTSANRTYGYNWITSSNIESLQLLHKKASTTIEEIEEVNEMVYDDKTTDGSALGFSIKLTPEVVNKITEYNRANEDNGGYINNSLSCYDAVVDGTTYKSIYCYSELIDQLLEENGDNVTVLPNRVNDESKRASDSNNSGYWTLWENYKIDKTSDSVIGGPAWK